ncbi:hypothetical protein ACFSJ3_08925 [Corallincola platygyrae]|uniref:Uncharacterized protein n=1 Tax=Corallincola platygyrae TaxID=1193278 RepID=A0ABW4XP42_9GAMM
MRPISSLALSLSLVAAPSIAVDSVPKEMLQRMMTKSMAEQCANEVYTGCLGISANDCHQFTKSYLSQCISKLPDVIHMNPATEAEMVACGTQIAAKYGFDAEKSEICDEQMEAYEDANPDWAEGIDPNDHEALMAAEMENRQQEMDEFVDSMREASGGDSRIGEVTLPIYEPYELGIHLADGMQMEGIKGLPVVTFKAAGSVEKVLAFYKQKLPHFKSAPDEPNLLVEKLLPGDASMYKYINVPHVSVYGADGETYVQLVYRR